MPAPNPVQILAIAGSLRKGSLNTAALRAAQELAPQGVTVEPFDLAFVPLYNEDVRQRGFPPAVQKLRAGIREADALLISTPESNTSVPGVLKNAIDWASRPPDQPFDGKPTALLSVSRTSTGVLAQAHLRQILASVDAPVLNRPEVFIPVADAKFDVRGTLTDEQTRGQIRDLLAALKAWAERRNPGWSAHGATVSPGQGGMTARELSGVAERLDRIDADLAALLQRETTKEWYTTEELARLLGKAEFTVREWCRNGRVKAQKRESGRGPHAAWVVSDEEVQRYRREGLRPFRTQ